MVLIIKDQFYQPSYMSNTDCAYPLRDGEAELTWVAGYIQMKVFSELVR